MFYIWLIIPTIVSALFGFKLTEVWLRANIIKKQAENGSVCFVGNCASLFFDKTDGEVRFNGGVQPNAFVLTFGTQPGTICSPIECWFHRNDPVNIRQVLEVANERQQIAIISEYPQLRRLTHFWSDIIETEKLYGTKLQLANIKKEKGDKILHEGVWSIK